MLNGIWAGMVLLGVAYAAINRTLGDVGSAALNGAKEAVTLVLTMMGAMGFWCGMMEIARESGLLGAMTRALRPVIYWLFPNLPREDIVGEEIATNMIANLFGLGSAATPAGLKAMASLERIEEKRRAEEEKEMSGLEEKPARGRMGKAVSKKGGSLTGAAPRGVASREMCTFLIVNISSLQLLPVTMIAYRAQYGSANPTAIVGPSLIATMVSTAAGVIFCRLMDRRKR